MTIAEFITGVTVNISNQTQRCSITPNIIGGSLVNLATILSAYTTVWSVREIPSGATNGSNVTFTLANTPNFGQESIYKSGVLLNSGVSYDYTITGNTFTMITPPADGVLVLATYPYNV